VASDLPVEFFVDGLPSGSIGDVLAFINKLALNLKSDGLVLDDASDDIVRRLDSVVVTGELCTFVENWLEKVGGELILTSFPDIL